MIQDIAPHIFNNQFVPGKLPENGSPVFCFSGRNILVDISGDKIKLPTKEQLGSVELNYLFTIDETDFYRPVNPGEIAIPEGFEYRNVREVRATQKGPGYIMFAIYTASHLDHWYSDNKFCGRCGTKTVHSDTERAVVCPDCAKIIYPRINPAVIVAVTNGDKLLLTKYRGREISYYALVAGFTEIGETFEECVSREVMEETGLKVKNIRYYKSQPWGAAADILAGYFCDVDGDETIHMDESELKLAQWVERSEIELQPDAFSLTNEMMTIFKNGVNV